jgi:hypothetical protein
LKKLARHFSASRWTSLTAVHFCADIMSEELSHSIINAGTAPGAQPVFDLAKFWQEQLSLADNFDSDFKNHPLPLARIKKVMKTDQDVKVRSNRTL